MTYDQLVAFVTVASTGAFSAASKVLHKTQPAVSKLIRNLESEIGLTLFDRSQYRATLTDVGRRFHARALAVVSETEALRGYGLALAGAPEQEVRLVFEAITPLSLVLPVLRRVEDRFPMLRYALRTERGPGVLAALLEGSADLVVTVAAGVDRRRIASQRLCDVRIVPVARFDHPLALAPSPVPIELLREYPQIVLRDSGGSELARDINLIEGGRRWSVTDVGAKRELIAAGMGWGGLPEHVVAGALERGELVRLDVREFEVEAISLALLRRRDRAIGVVAEALWTELALAARRG
jgi:DNA-binding transcriptional LysR family regulator